MFREHITRSAVTAAAAWSVLSAATAAAEVAIAVRFVVADPALASRLGAGQGTLEHDMSAWLAGRMAEEFPYWDYRASDPASAPALEVQLEHAPPDWQLAIVLTAQSGQTARWTARWLTDADMLRVGNPPPDLPATLQQAITDQFLRVKTEELFAELRKIPLGSDARIEATSAPEAVLPLGWARHRPLALSDFTLLYRTTAGIANVTCTGVGTTSAYPAPPPSAGLVVMLHDFELGGRSEPVAPHLGELGALEPFAILLTRFDGRGLALPADDAGPSISIAP